MLVRLGWGRSTRHRVLGCTDPRVTTKTKAYGADYGKCFRRCIEDVTAWAWDGDECILFSALVLTADTSAPDVAARLVDLLTARKETGYAQRVAASYDVSGDDLTDDIDRAAANLSAGDYFVCYLSGRHQIVDKDIIVVGPPPTTLRQVVQRLLGSASPRGLLVIIDGYGDGAGLHTAAVDAITALGPTFPWCVITEAVDTSLVDPLNTPLIEALANGLGDAAGGHMALWFRASDLHREATGIAKRHNVVPPLMTASESPFLLVGFVPRASTFPEFSETLELALSGGGYRASAFSLGALLYLVHSGLNKRVESIVSVSGGSITNAWVGQHVDFSKLESIEEFAPCVQELASRLSSASLMSLRNAFFLVWLAVLAACGVLAGITAVATWPWRIVDLPMLLAVLSAIPVVIRLRGQVVTAWLARVYAPSSRYRMVGDLGDRDVEHVFTATDLCTGTPFFMSSRSFAASNGQTFSQVWGLRQGRTVPLYKAVRASAAFPPLIPAVRLRLEPHADGTGELNWIWLSDGGIWNNLATDWSQLRIDIFSSRWRQLSADGTPFGDIAPAGPTGGVRLVIDASAPLVYRRMRTLWFPFVSFFDTAVRALLTSYASTIAGRRPEPTQARSRMLLNPERWWADWPQPHMTSNEQPGSAPPLELIVGMVEPGKISESWSTDWLGEHWRTIDKRYPAELSAAEGGLPQIRSDRPTVGTTLNKLPRKVVLSLIVDGYLATRETLVTAFETHRPPAIPDAAWFAQTVGLGE